jgi:pantetheine-phosphate adenylyltransferase
MKNIAIYPGTFDPITNGHIDVIKKGLKLADKIIVGISNGNQKNFLFPIDERYKIVSRALYNDLKFSKNKIQVIRFNSLTTELCKKYKSNLILRGLRAVSDFEYEFQLAGMNRKLNNKVETVFLMSDVENQIISSRFVKEIAIHKGDLRKFTTKSTIKSLKKIYA